jgi:hypothetical protein
MVDKNDLQQEAVMQFAYYLLARQLNMQHL